MAKIYYGVVTSKPSNEDRNYNISFFTDGEDCQRNIPKYYFNEKLEKNDIIKVTNWKRKNVISFRYEKATYAEVFALYRDALEVLVPDGDLLPNFEIYKDLLIKPE